jgi:mannose-1-phosphate guanylyltransferase
VSALIPKPRSSELEPWCVLLTSRINATPGLSVRGPTATLSSVLRKNSLSDSMRRAQSVTQAERIAVVATQTRGAQGTEAANLRPANFFVQPCERGTAYEILLTLMHLENCVTAETPILFLPSDHVVSDGEVFTRSLKEMINWIGEDSRPVYLLGAAPEGPHDRLGYIVPWYDAMNTAAGVYDFVEAPDVRQARKLIHAGGLWNTFIFGSSLGSLIDLFPEKYHSVMRSIRAALKADRLGQACSNELRSLYANLTPKDFSQDILANRKDRLNVLRMPRCGWWPLLAPRHNLQTSKSII